MARASAAVSTGPWPGATCCRGVVPEQVDQACERRAVFGCPRGERELRGREMVAHREQVELPDSVGGAVGGVAAESGRLDDERAYLMRDAASSARSTRGSPASAQSVRGGGLGKPLEPAAAGHEGRGSGTHRRDRIGKRRNPADVIPVRMGDEHVVTRAPRAAARAPIRATSSAEIQGSTTTASSSGDQQQ